jgi:hypothetical protein
VSALGRFTATVMTAVALAAIVLGVRSIPDIRRYLKMRQM